MAQPPQQGPPPVSLLMQPTTSASGASTASNGGSPSMQAAHNRSMNNWDGDRMLHVYMIDYCRKRGYNAVVNALCQQTGNTSDVKAPIDAPQGLLFEWWVVFWEIFTAKSEDDPKKNAVAYLQDQRAKNYRPMHPADVKPPIGVQMPGHNYNGPHPPPPPGATMSGPGPFPGHPPGHPAQQPPGMQRMPTPNGVLPPGQQQHPPQPPGAPTPVPPPSQHVNGPQPYPPQPQPQSQQPPHPNAANGPQGPPPPNQGPGGPQQMGMGNRPGAPTGPQMMGAQRPGIGQGMPNGQVGHPPFAGSPLGPGAGGPNPSPRTSHMGPPQGLRGHPQQPGQHPQQQGGPANAPTPGSSGMPNGMGGNPNSVMAAQQFMNVARPGSRSGTPGSQVGAGSQPGAGMSPSRTGGPPMGPGVQARPGSQMGLQQPGSQGSPFTGPMPGPPGVFPVSPPQMVEQAMRALGLHGRPQESLNQEERNNLSAFLRSMQGQRQPGMGTPRMASGANPVIPGAPQPGPSGPQGGMPGTNFPQPFPPSQQMMGQPPQQMKRPGSPSMQLDAPNESSPPQKRLRKDSQNSSTPSMSGFTPGAPGANGQQQPPMLNGAATPNMMRPPPGAPGNPGQPMNPMMLNGGQHGPPGTNPMQLRGPQQQGPQRPPMSMPNKAGGLVPNPHQAGLPIHVKNEPGNMDPQQQTGNVGPRGQPPKVQPSPSIPNAKAPGSMPPPNLTPNPSQIANKAGIKEESSLDGTAKSSPGMKPAMQNPPTPVPNPATPATAQNSSLGTNIFNSTIGPSPGAILAQQANNMNQSTTPNNASGPGSSANPQSAATANAGAFNFMGADMYGGTDFGLLDYGFGGGLSRADGPSGTEDAGFDLLAEFFDQNALGSMAGDEDFTAAAAAGGSS
ncbi:Transcriptional activator flo8 [Tulasnella sp. 408]|nr:Transcriptional activator flo8 [Tulasnella sp. 408]